MSTTQTQPAAKSILLADFIYKLNNNFIDRYQFWFTLTTGSYVEVSEKGNSASILYVITDLTSTGALPNQVASYSTTGNTAAVTNGISFTPPAKAGTYRLSATVDVTAWTTPASFTITGAYKDASGTARTDTFAVARDTGTQPAAGAITAISRWHGQSLLLQIDNSATAITLSTTGTFTGSPVYNLAGVLEQLV